MQKVQIIKYVICLDIEQILISTIATKPNVSGLALPLIKYSSLIN